VRDRRPALWILTWPAAGGVAGRAQPESPESQADTQVPLGSLSTLSFAVPQVPLIRGPGAAQLEERRAPERPRCSA
jgi:hypothetical protein